MGELSEQNQALIERVNPSGMPRAFTSASQETLLNRLIAAAPALLEAVADFCRVYEGFQDGDGNPCPQVARGLAALRLATEPAPFSPTPSKERTMEASELIEAARAVASEFAHGHPLIARLRDAVLAAEALSSGEAVAWRYRYPLGNGRGWTAWSHCSSRVNAEDIAGPGGEVEPLYAAPALSTPMPSREEVALDRGDKIALDDLVKFVANLDAEDYPNHAPWDTAFPAGHYRTFARLLSLFSSSLGGREDTAARADLSPDSRSPDQHSAGGEG